MTTTKVIITSVLLAIWMMPPAKVPFFFSFFLYQGCHRDCLSSFMFCAIAHRAKWDILNISKPLIFGTFSCSPFGITCYIVLFSLFFLFCRNHKCSAFLFCWCSGFLWFGNTFFFLFSPCYFTSHFPFTYYDSWFLEAHIPHFAVIFFASLHCRTSI